MLSTASNIHWYWRRRGKVRRLGSAALSLLSQVGVSSFGWELTDPRHPRPYCQGSPRRARPSPGCPARCKWQELGLTLLLPAAPSGQTTGRRWGVLGPPKPPAPLDVEPRWQQRRHTTWHGKQELRAHNRAFDASQLSKARASAARPADAAARRRRRGRPQGQAADARARAGAGAIKSASSTYP